MGHLSVLSRFWSETRVRMWTPAQRGNHRRDWTSWVAAVFGGRRLLGTDVDSRASGELSAVGAGRALEKGGLVVDARDGTVRWFGVTAGATRHGGSWEVGRQCRRDGVMGSAAPIQQRPRRIEAPSRRRIRVWLDTSFRRWAKEGLHRIRRGRGDRGARRRVCDRAPIVASGRDRIAVLAHDDAATQ